jgi:hypothetical protein
MSKKADAIDKAVRDELMKETGLGTDYGKKLGADYRYSTTTIQIFLKAVAQRLKPKYTFDWTSLPPSEAVAATVADLETKIAARTKLAGR